MKKILLLLMSIIPLTGCAELQQLASQLPQDAGILSNSDISSGLKQALNQGIEQRVTTLMATDGFLKNDLVKILLPAELQKVDRGLRKIGLSNIAEDGLKLLNRAAEDATKEALPIFVDAIKNMGITDAKSILLGDQRAATRFLETKTQIALYERFAPVIDKNLREVGATALWSGAITKYNNLPLTSDLNPDLTDYVTREALAGIFKMIALEEIEIRGKTAARTTDLMRRIFALQDKP
jgi:hypothetical protein